MDADEVMRRKAIAFDPCNREGFDYDKQKGPSIEAPAGALLAFPIRVCLHTLACLCA